MSPSLLRGVGLMGGVLLASCTALHSDAPRLLGAGVPVPAAGETQPVGTINIDAADDPEIWVDPADPSRVLIFGTDKRAGLYVYGLDGAVRQFIADGRLNNVDLRSGFPTPDGERVLIAASDRERMGAALYLMNPATLEITPWGVVPLDLSDPYGLCMARLGDRYVVIVNSTDGQVRQVEVSAGPDGAHRAVEQRRWRIASQPEGCVADESRGWLYIGEEARGVWRFQLDPARPASGELVARAPSSELQPDVEGMSVIEDAAGVWLVVSSQGDSAFAVYRIDGERPVYAGRFSVAGANGADPVSGTDGLAAHGGPVGSFASGLVVVQDHIDTDGEAATPRYWRQNFKLVAWANIRRALDLDRR